MPLETIAATIIPTIVGPGTKPSAKLPAKLPAKANPTPDASKRFVADWSEELAQIEVELKRLSWSDAQEADYLQRTYGQRSRDYITDFDQLSNYLSYLRALPSHFSPPPIEPETTADLSDDPVAGRRLEIPLVPPETDLAPISGDDDGPPWIDPGPDADVEEFAPPRFATSIADPAARVEPAAIAPPIGSPERSALPPPDGTDRLLSREEMLDLSAAECKRLKWSNRQGSDYLKATYGKPTRKDLTNEDLWDFLQYLQSLSMTSEQLPF